MREVQGLNPGFILVLFSSPIIFLMPGYVPDFIPSLHIIPSPDLIPYSDSKYRFFPGATNC